VGVKLLDPSIVSQLGLRPVDGRAVKFRSTEDSQTPTSSTSRSSSYPSSSSVQSFDSVDHPSVVQEENTLSLKLSRYQSYPSRLRAQTRLTTPRPLSLPADNTVLPGGMNSAIEGSDSTEEQPLTLMQKLRALSTSASKTLIPRTLPSPPAPLFRRTAGSQSNMPSPDSLEGEAPRRLPSSDFERSGSVSTNCSDTPDVVRRPSDLAGGIALSEIAVEERVPDIITQPKSPQ
jgi:hypothetical protein